MPPYMGFCEIKEIPGGSKVDGYKDQIELLGFEHEILQPTSPSASGRGTHTVSQSEHGAFFIRKEQDEATPKFMQYASNGKHIPKVTVTLLRQAGEKSIAYMKIAFEDCAISAYKVQADSNNNGLPEERVGIAYGKITMTYTSSDTTGAPGGNVMAEFDRRTAVSK
jgi:type VI secretion system secreted protein Hcp